MSLSPLGADMTIDAAAQAASNIATALAVLVGGTWAYLKFVLGRTFKYRAELSTHSKFIEQSGTFFVFVRVSIKNSGAAKIPLDREMQVIRLFGCVKAEPPLELDWQHITTVNIFQDHAWIEPGETISDEVALPVSGSDDVSWLTLQIKSRSVAEKKAVQKVMHRNPTSWASVELVFTSPVGEDDKK